MGLACIPLHFWLTCLWQEIFLTGENLQSTRCLFYQHLKQNSQCQRGQDIMTYIANYFSKMHYLVGKHWSTPGNPFAYLGKYNAHLVIFMFKMSILTNVTDSYVLESISSPIRTYLVSFKVCQIMQCASDVLLENANWHQIFTTPILRRQELL